MPAAFYAQNMSVVEAYQFRGVKYDPADTEGMIQCLPRPQSAYLWPYDGARRGGGGLLMTEATLGEKWGGGIEPRCEGGRFGQ